MPKDVNGNNSKNQPENFVKKEIWEEKEIH